MDIPRFLINIEIHDNETNKDYNFGGFNTDHVYVMQQELQKAIDKLKEIYQESKKL